MSTDYVFSGEGARPWRPEDETAPMGVYGQTKREGERAVLSESDRSFIVRTAWVFGRNGGNFVRTMLRLSENQTVHMVLERTPPELVADISENGIVLSGGGSLLYGMDKLVTERTGIPAHVVDDALSCTAYGAGRMLSRLDSMPDGMMNFARRRQLDTGVK